MQNNNSNAMQIDNYKFTNQPSSIKPFGKGGNQQLKYNSDYYQHLLEQFDKTFLSKLVDLHNSLFNDYINFNEIDDLLDFFKDYKNQLEDLYYKSLLFPEKYKNARLVLFYF